MGVVIRQGSYSTALTVIGIIIGYVNVLYLFPTYLSPSEIGLTRVIQDFSMLLVPFAQLGTGQAVIRFFPGFQKDQAKKDHFPTLMLLIGTLGFIFFLVVFAALQDPISRLFVSRSPEVTNYLFLVAILVYTMVLTNILSDFIRSILQIVVPVLTKEVLLRVFTTACIALFALGVVSFDQFLLCIVGAYILNLIVLAGFLVYKGTFKVQLGFHRVFSKSDFRNIINYGLFVMLGAGGALVIAKVDSVMVTSMLGTSFNGVYTTVFFIAVLVEIPRRIVTMISSPLIARSAENERWNEIQDVYQKSSLNMMIVGGLVYIGIWANLDNLFALIPNSEVFVVGKWVVIIIGASKLLDMSAGLNGEIIALSKYYRMNILFTVLLAIVTIVANYLLIPIYGINGAALGTGLSVLLFNLVKFIFLRRALRLQPFTIGNLKVLVIGTVVLLAALAAPSLSQPIVDIALRSILITVAFIGLLLLTKSSREVEEIALHWRNKLFKKNSQGEH